MDKEISELKALYELKKGVIRERLREFRETGRGSDERIFAELCFCICTPQSRAKSAWFDAIYPLMNSGGLWTCSKSELMSCLKKSGVRFHRTKANYIVLARRLFDQKGIKSMIYESENAFELRDLLVKNVKGLGLKEASHFLRNIGLGEDLAILDRHILRNLVRLGVIEDMPKSLSRKRYLEIEKNLRRFSERVKIPMDELDLLLWFRETGEVFK